MVNDIPAGDLFLQCSQADSSRRFHTSADDPPPPLPGIVDIPAMHVNRSVDTYKIERVMTGLSYNFICKATPFFIIVQLFVGLLTKSKHKTTGSLTYKPSVLKEASHGQLL